MFETLENRQMFAATPLFISGTSVADNYRLNNSNGIISVFRNNALVSTHFAGDVSSVTVILGAGNDSLTMSGTPLTGKPIKVNGGTGDDVINGSAVKESLNGESGNDTINGGGGIDAVDGGFGNDRLVITDGTVHGGPGDDSISGGTAHFASNLLYGDAGNDRINAGPNGRTFMYGGDGADILTGSLGNDELYGENGNDTLRGGQGHDRMFGGNDNDTIFAARDGSPDGISGGAGFDTAEVDDRSFFAAFWEVQDSWSTVESVKKF